MKKSTEYNFSVKGDYSRIFNGRFQKFKRFPIAHWDRRTFGSNEPMGSAPVNTQCAFD